MGDQGDSGVGGSRRAVEGEAKRRKENRTPAMLGVSLPGDSDVAR